MVRLGLMMLGVVMCAGDVLALSRQAQEFVDIQARIAPDQCMLQKLSAQAAAAQRAGDQGKRQELNAQMLPIAKRIQGYKPRLEELAKAIRNPSPDYDAVVHQTQELFAKCKP